MAHVLDGTWPRRAEKAPVAPRGDGRWLGLALLLGMGLWGLIAACVALAVGVI